MSATRQGPWFGPVYGWQAAAHELGCSVTWVRKLVRAGKGSPSVPVGGADARRVFSRDDLEELARAIGRELREEAPAQPAA